MSESTYNDKMQILDNICNIEDLEINKKGGKKYNRIDIFKKLESEIGNKLKVSDWNNLAENNFQTVRQITGSYETGVISIRLKQNDKSDETDQISKIFISLGKKDSKKKAFNKYECASLLKSYEENLKFMVFTKPEKNMRFFRGFYEIKEKPKISKNENIAYFILEMDNNTKDFWKSDSGLEKCKNMYNYFNNLE